MKRIASVIRSWRREPLLHFLLLGAILLGLSRVLAPWLIPIEQITVTTADIERLRREWQNDMKRAPTDAELNTALHHWLDDDILVREALRLGLDRTDPVTRQRLLINLRFADPETQLDDQSLLREARAMGMATRDLVARRRLIDVMEQRIASNATLGDAEVRDFVAQHAARYGIQGHYSVQQYFFNKDLRHAATHNDATACFQKLQLNPIGPCAADTFLLGSQLNALTAEDLAHAFGPDTGKRIASLPIHQWSEPIESPYGWHLFRIDAFTPAADADYAQVRQRAAYALLSERETQVVEKALENIRHRYVIRLPAEQAGETP